MQVHISLHLKMKRRTKLQMYVSICLLVKKLIREHWKVSSRLPKAKREDSILPGSKTLATVLSADSCIDESMNLIEGETWMTKIDWRIKYKGANKTMKGQIIFFLRGSARLFPAYLLQVAPVQVLGNLVIISPPYH
jgi:hypothetical protein